MRTLEDVYRIFNGSDGFETRELYAQLEALGPAGMVACNLFRAQKTSTRAKVYRGGGFRGKAYGRKQWSMDNLVALLTAHAEALGLRWGWQLDPDQARHCWVLYIDLPCGQVSFHTEYRGSGPDYAGAWDGMKGASPGRVCSFAVAVLSGAFPKEVGGK